MRAAAAAARCTAQLSPSKRLARRPARRVASRRRDPSQEFRMGVRLAQAMAPADVSTLGLSACWGQSHSAMALRTDPSGASSAPCSRRKASRCTCWHRAHADFIVACRHDMRKSGAAPPTQMTCVNLGAPTHAHTPPRRDDRCVMSEVVCPRAHSLFVPTINCITSFVCFCVTHTHVRNGFARREQADRRPQREEHTLLHPQQVARRIGPAPPVRAGGAAASQGAFLLRQAAWSCR